MLVTHMFENNILLASLHVESRQRDVGSAIMVSSRPQMMSAWTCQQRRLRTHQKQSATRIRATARKTAVSAIWNDQKRLAG